MAQSASVESRNAQSFDRRKGAVMLDLRHAHRMSVEKPGWIISDDGHKKPCIVSNLSHNGAKVILLSRYDLPVEFTLTISGAEHRSRIVWRTCFNVGVQFAPLQEEQTATQCAA
jgi:hypothetical protein